jgi:hypothetical protein
MRSSEPLSTNGCSAFTCCGSDGSERYNIVAQDIYGQECVDSYNAEHLLVKINQ